MQTPERVTLRVIVPHLNDLWDARNGAPRLLHKATGYFDLEAELLITTKAQSWLRADFLVKSPGSYLGSRKGQMVQDGAGAHYWIPAGLWGFWQGNPGKLTRLNQERPWQGVDAPDHPVRVRMTRRGDLWKAYWSVDGQTWNVCSVQDAPAPETVFAGWVFRRWAEDGPLGKEPGVFTLRDIRLRTEPLDTAESPAWDTFCQNAQVTAEGLGTRLVLDGKGPGEARAVSAGRLSGDFDVTIGYDTVQWTAQPGETRSWFVAAATGDEMWRLHIGGMRSDDANPQRLFSHARLNGTWGNYGAAVADAPKGRLRLVRKDEVVSTLYDVGEGWKELGVAGQRISEPLHLWLKASNDKAKTHVPFTVVYTIESVAPPLVDTDRLTNEKPGSPASQAATPATVTGSVVMCQQVDAQNNPIDPATVFAGPAGPAGAPGMPGEPGPTPDTVHAVAGFEGVPTGGVMECVWQRDGKEFSRDRVTVPAGIGGWVWSWGPREGGLPAGNYGVALTYAGNEIARMDFQIVPGPRGPRGPEG